MLSARIAFLRRQLGLNQAQLAARLGISPSAVGMYEQGRREPDCKTLCALARALDTTVDYLLTGSGVPGEDAALRSAFNRARRRLEAQPVTLRSADGSVLPEGTLVKIVKLEGVKLYVEPVHTPVL